MSFIQMFSVPRFRILPEQALTYLLTVSAKMVPAHKDGTFLGGFTFGFKPCGTSQDLDQLRGILPDLFLVAEIRHLANQMHSGLGLSTISGTGIVKVQVLASWNAWPKFAQGPPSEHQRIDQSQYGKGSEFVENLVVLGI